MISKTKNISKAREDVYYKCYCHFESKALQGIRRHAHKHRSTLHGVSATTCRLAPNRETYLFHHKVVKTSPVNRHEPWDNEPEELEHLEKGFHMEEESTLAVSSKCVDDDVQDDDSELDSQSLSQKPLQANQEYRVPVKVPVQEKRISTRVVKSNEIMDPVINEEMPFKVVKPRGRRKCMKPPLLKKQTSAGVVFGVKAIYLNKVLSSSLYIQVEEYLTNLRETQPINQKDIYMWFRDKVILMNLLLVAEQTYTKSKKNYNFKAFDPSQWVAVTNYFLGKFLPNILSSTDIKGELEALKSSIRSVLESYNELKAFFEWINRQNPLMKFHFNEKCFMLQH